MRQPFGVRVQVEDYGNVRTCDRLTSQPQCSSDSVIIGIVSTIQVSKIIIYPIKSLDGIEVDDIGILPGGALEHDREFALHDVEGRWVNGKRDGRINSIRSQYDLANQTVSLRIGESAGWETFHLIDDRPKLEAWFESYFGLPVQLKQDLNAGFPDDLHALGPTVISTATLIEIDSWCGVSNLAETRRRFRANIELSVDIPFWEDRLFGKRNEDVGFLLGEAEFFGVGPCKRCVVPTRDSQTGEVSPDFHKTFDTKRRASVPEWSLKARFGPYFYRVAINTRVNPTETGKRIRVGDEFRLAEPKSEHGGSVSLIPVT